MKVPFSWLKQYVDIDVTAQELEDKLFGCGFEVEELIDLGGEISKVVVGVVTECVPQEGTHLHICKVDCGEYGHDIQISTGASNVYEGMHTPAALDGSTLPGGIKIKAKPLMGVESNGMLCSGEELGLNDDLYPGAEVYGLLDLPKDTVPGTPIQKVVGLDDYIFDISVTANRADCQSVLGIAREVAAVLGKPLKMPATDYTVSDTTDDRLSITVEAPDLCPRYIGHYVRNITPGPSPRWMKRQLALCGLRSISNVVDITNYVMLEIGQPMHAFDMDTLESCQIIVRRAKDGEEITTLDEKNFKLTPNNLVICDGSKPVALAGVMGGMDSEIEDDTVDVMVESACFNAGRTSHTSRDLSLISDASIRFERQVDETGCVDVANVTCALIEEIAGGEVAPGYVDVFPAPKTIDSIKLRLARVHAICGADIEPDFIERSLTRLGCTVERDGEDFMVTPPSFRPDLPREIDLIEEVLRLWGMGRVAATIPAAKNHIGGLTREQKLTRKVGEILRACGLNETTTFGFAAPGDLEKIGMPTEGRGCPVVLMNPLVAEQTEMRRSLLPGLLQSVAYNEAHGTPNVHLYEVGSLFHGRENASLPKETKSVAGVLSGQWSEQSWNMKYRKLRFFFGKGIVEELLAQLRIEKVRFRPVEGEGYAFLQPGRAAEVLSGGTVLGWVGEIHPEAREAMGIDEVVVAFELDLDKLIKGARNQENYREFSQYPAVEHDLAIVVDNTVTCEDLERRITSAGGKLLEGVRLFDVYRDPIRIGAGKKSMAFALTYRSDDHTLTSEEVEKAHQKIVTKVCKGVNGEVRG